MARNKRTIISARRRVLRGQYKKLQKEIKTIEKLKSCFDSFVTTVVQGSVIYTKTIGSVTAVSILQMSLPTMLKEKRRELISLSRKLKKNG